MIASGPPTAASVPELVAGRYRPGPLLGRGAAGAVFAAEDLRTGTRVALKLVPLRPGTAAADSGREQRAAARLAHPGIAAVLDAGVEAGCAWLASELVGGASLARYTEAVRLLPEPVVLRVGARIAEALAHAHSRGVVHRDLKPSNVKVDVTTGAVKLLDFGVALVDGSAATRTGMTLGTPSYMAPEQLAGAPASPASDAYSLGVLLFELLAGRRPHEAATLGELLREVAGGAPARLDALRPGLPPGVLAAVDELLARDPARRPADLGRFATRLDTLAREFDADRRRQS